MEAINIEQLLVATGDAIVVTDRHEKITVWNPAATRIFGYTESEAVGKTLDLIVPQRQRDRHSEGYAKSMQTGTTRYGATVLRVPALHKDGNTLSIAFTVGMLKDNEQVTGVVAVIRDETERFAQERELRKQLAELTPQ